MYFLQEGKCIKITIFRLLGLIWVYVCAGFPLECPEPAQWSIRAMAHCPDPSKYFCLKNDLINGYSENCTVSDFQQPGRKGVLRGGMDAEICASQRYQPWPLTFFTNASTNCIFLKSKCNDEGQVIHGNGNRNNDITCRCDYTSSYDFLIKPRNPCFCVPSEEDCSCYLKTCSKSTYTLSPDYDCIPKNMNLTVFHCTVISRDRVSSPGNNSHTKGISYNVKENVSIQARSKLHTWIILAAICIGFCIVVSSYQLCENCCNRGTNVDKSQEQHQTTLYQHQSLELIEPIGGDRIKKQVDANDEERRRDLDINGTNVDKPQEGPQTVPDKHLSQKIKKNTLKMDIKACLSNGISTNCDQPQEGHQTTVDKHQSLEIKNDRIRNPIDEKDIEGRLDQDGNSNDKKDGTECKYCDAMALFKCYECDSFLCQECLVTHNGKPRNENHLHQPTSDSYILHCRFRLDQNVMIQDVNCLPDGSLVITTNEKAKELMTCSIEGRDKKYISINNLVDKIAVIDNNNVAVLLKQFGTTTVVLVDIQKLNTEKRIKHKDCKRHTNSPFICIENNLYIGDFYNVFVIDQSGSKLKPLKICTPLDMCYDINSLHIYYIYINEQRSQISCIDTVGNNISTFIDPKLKRPISLTSDDKGNVLVLCKNEDRGTVYNAIEVDSNGKSIERAITNIKIPVYCSPNIIFNRPEKAIVIGVDGTVCVYKKMSNSIK